MDGIIQITQHNSPKGFLFMTADGAIPAVITTGKIMAEPENVSALIAVINNMIHTFLLSFY